jgi:alpha-tubulin suppressor-like RCC1 family protein
MSTLLVANVQFDAGGSNKIYYDGANLNITSANAVISGRLTANAMYAPSYYDSSNTSFYVDPAANSVMAGLRVTQMGLNNITSMSKAQLNGFLMVINGKVFTCHGNNGTWGYYTSGRGTTGTSPVYGFNSMRVVNFPGETGTLTKAGVCGDSVAYALFSTGNLYTWGFNANGQTGLNSTAVVAVPTLAATSVTNVWDHPSNNDYSGDNTRLFIKKTDNYIYATGYNGYGQLGDTTTVSKQVFTQLTGLGTTVTSVWPIGSTYGFTFFQKADNSIWACGYNGYGALGNATTTNQATPVDVTTNWGGLTGSARVIKKVIGGSGGHDGTTAYSYGWAVMLLDDGTTTYLRSAGYNGAGSVGNGTTTASSISTPITPAVGAGRITTISGGGGAAGSGTTMVLMASGAMYNWGYNGYGQLGDGTTTNNGTPTQRVASGVTGIYYDYTNHVQGWITAAFYSTSTALYGAGYNGYGQLGVGDTTNRSSFTRVLLPQDFVVSDIGSFNSTYPVASYLAIGTDGRMYAWGYNGQYNISPDTTNNCLAPVQINLPLGA